MFRYLYNAKGFALFLVLTFCSMSTADLAQNPTMGSFQKTTRSAQLDDNDEHRYVVMYRANSTHFSERLARSRRKLSGAVPIENFFPELNTEIVYIESEADIAALESENDVMLVEKGEMNPFIHSFIIKLHAVHIFFIISILILNSAYYRRQGLFD